MQLALKTYFYYLPYALVRGFTSGSSFAEKKVIYEKLTGIVVVVDENYDVYFQI